MKKRRLHKIPLKIHLGIILVLGLCILTIINISGSLGRPAQTPVFPQQTAAASSHGENTTTEVIYRGSPQQEAYEYVHPTAGYTVEVPPGWLLGFTGTPYNPHLAAVLHSPDFVKEPVEDSESTIRSGSEIFIYVEPPRAKAPTVQAEYDFITKLGETPLGQLTSVTVDGMPGLNYFRSPGGDYKPFQTAIVYKDHRMYRFLYRTAISDDSNPLPSFVRDQPAYDRVLSAFKLPAQAPNFKYENL